MLAALTVDPAAYIYYFKTNTDQRIWKLSYIMYQITESSFTEKCINWEKVLNALKNG